MEEGEEEEWREGETEGEEEEMERKRDCEGE